MEDSSKLFEVHKHVLYDACRGLRASLNATTSHKNPLNLSLVTAECFETVCRWLYSKDLVVKELNLNKDGTIKNNSAKRCDVNMRSGNAVIRDGGDQFDQDYIHIEAEIKPQDTKTNHPWYTGLDRNGRIFARLVDLYAFAAKYDAPRLRRNVILAWQRFSISCNCLPPAPVVSRAFSRMNGDEPLCKYIILWYGYFTGNVPFEAAEFSSMSPAFLFGVLEIMYQKQAGGYHFVGLDQNWCEFHEHADSDETKECLKARHTDPDAVAKLAEDLWDSISPTRRNR